MLLMKQLSQIYMTLQLKLNYQTLNASEGIKKKIREEFRYIKETMDFDKKSHEIFSNWYIDGRLYYLKVIDQKNPQEGLKDLRYIDPMKIKFSSREERKMVRKTMIQILMNIIFNQNQTKDDKNMSRYKRFNHILTSVSGSNKNSITSNQLRMNET